MTLLLRWIVSAVALYATVYVGKALGLRFWIAPGALGVEAALLFVVLLAIVNSTLGPLVKLLTLPITCLTLGLFSFVVNALMFWLVGKLVHNLTLGFNVVGFKAVLFGSVVMALTGGALNMIGSSQDARRR